MNNKHPWVSLKTFSSLHSFTESVLCYLFARSFFSFYFFSPQQHSHLMLLLILGRVYQSRHGWSGGVFVIMKIHQTAPGDFCIFGHFHSLARANSVCLFLLYHSWRTVCFHEWSEQDHFLKPCVLSSVENSSKWRSGVKLLSGLVCTRSNN